MSTKLLRHGLLAFTCIIQAVSQNAYAQGTVYLSHLGSIADTGEGVGAATPFAIYFETGTNANGYSLDSIQLRIAGVLGTPTGFDVSLYNNNGGVPGSSLEPLSGSIPSGVGIYSFFVV